MSQRAPRARILVVEDEARLRGLLRLYLERAGYEVAEAADGRSALEAVDETPPDLLVVDLMLPGLHGEALIRAIRETSDVPILIASAKRSDVERIAGLRLGADDYLPKPYNVHELVERVHAILRRSGRGRVEMSAEPLSFAGRRLVIDPLTRAYTWTDPVGDPAAESGGDQVGDPADSRRGAVGGPREGRLTPAELRLLVALVGGGGVPLDRDALLRAAGGAHAETARTVDVHVGNLRRKLGDDAAHPWAIETIPEAGYRWIAPVDEPATRNGGPAGASG
jgi:DNA-binding response OmpR family regulator